MSVPFEAYRRLLPFLRRQRRRLAGVLLLTLLMSGVAALQPLPLRLIVDDALGSGSGPAWLGAALRAAGWEPSAVALLVAGAAGTILLFGFQSLLDAALSRIWTVTGQSLVYDLAGAVFARLQRLSLVFHRRQGVGDSLSRITGDTWCIYTLASDLLIAPVEHVFRLLLVGVVAWSLDPHLAALTFAAAPLLALSSFVFGRRLKHKARLGREAASRLLSFVHQTLTTIPVVQAFSAQLHNRRRFETLAGDAVDVSRRSALLTSGFGMWNGLVTTVGAAAVLWVGGMRVVEGTLTIGTLLVFLAYMKTLHASAEGLISVYGALKPVEASIDRLLEVLDSQEDVPEPERPRSLPPRTAGAGRRVSLEDVRFGYAPGRPILDGVSLEVRPGECVALVGATGVGKTTLVSLVPRLFDPWSGRVCLDGVDVREISLAELRSQVALVQQEPFLLPQSVAENIAWGRPDAGEDAVREAARAAGAHEFIEALPDGYRTLLGERGATLSGGERQRISIARALLKDAPVLILDEPTSALDAATEAALLEALERLMQGRATLMIAHRLSTIRRADQIAVLGPGGIEELGRHEELLSRRGAYSRFHAMQSEGAMEAVA